MKTDMAKSKKSHIYLDTSAFLAILLGEDQYRSLLKFIGKRKVCSSTLLIIETERNLIRMIREKIIDENSYFAAKDAIAGEIQKMLLKDFTLDLCLNTQFPTVKTPRSLDLAHLRTALWFKKRFENIDFVTLDRHQLDCAKELGLDTYNA